MRQFPPPIRQPPLPSPSSRHHRRDALLKIGVTDPHLNLIPTLMVNNEEGNSEMAGGKRNRVSVNLPCFLRTCKSQTSSKTNIESLPDELLLEILQHVGAQDIFEAAIAVCRKWYNMIDTRNFIYSHLENSTPGVILKNYLERRLPIYVAMVKGQIEISKMPYEFESCCWSSCNGLALEGHPKHDSDLCIVNPVTKQLLELPAYGNFHPGLRAYSGIAYAAASVEYKVVCLSDANKMGLTPVALLGCSILTVGVDKSWRRVHIQHLSLKARELLKNTPLTTEGFLHWTRREVGTHILTLNVETEVITETRVPQGCNSGGQESNYCLSNGRCLTVFVGRSEFSWDVWELKKPEIGEWVKMISIDLEGQKWKFEQLRGRYSPLLTIEPVAWLNYTEWLLLRVLSTECFLYNVGKQESELLDLKLGRYFFSFPVHRKSLVWLEG